MTDLADLAVELRVYDSSGANLLGGGPLVGARARRWVEELNGSGEGSFEIHRDDPQFTGTPALLDYGNIVRCYVGGSAVFAWRIDAVDQTPHTENEEGGDWLAVSGLGVMSILDDAVVWPEYGVDGLTANERQFSWVSADFDDTSWSAATSQGTQASPTASAVWPGNPAGWPDPDAHWLWAGAGGTVAPGDAYLRKTFTTGSDLDVAIYATADDEFDLFLDGVQILSARGPFQWRRTFEAKLTLPSGDHTLAMRVRNLLRPTGDSPAAGLVSIWQVDSFGDPTTNIVRSDTSWKGIAYPDPVPGFNAGQFLRILIEEAADRGVGEFDEVTLQFTDSQDSDGNAWATEFATQLQVGGRYQRAIDYVIETIADVWMDPDLGLYVAPTRGDDVSGSVAFTVGDDIVADAYAGQRPTANALLTHHQLGWLEQTEDTSIGSYGRREGFLSLANTVSDDVAERVGDTAFGLHAWPDDQITLEVEPVTGRVPWVDYAVGDTVTAPDSSGSNQTYRVRAIELVEYGEVGRFRARPLLSTLRYERDQLQKRWLSAMDDGTLGGTIHSAAPFDRSGEVATPHEPVSLGGTPTVVLAPSDASTLSKSKADVVALAGADQAAVDAAKAMLIAAGGGRLLITEGTITNVVLQFHETDIPDAGITIEGMGADATAFDFSTVERYGGNGSGPHIGPFIVRNLSLVNESRLFSDFVTELRIQNVTLDNSQVYSWAAVSTLVDNVLVQNYNAAITNRLTNSALQFLTADEHSHVVINNVVGVDVDQELINVAGQSEDESGTPTDPTMRASITGVTATRCLDFGILVEHCVVAIAGVTTEACGTGIAFNSAWGTVHGWTSYEDTQSLYVGDGVSKAVVSGMAMSTTGGVRTVAAITGNV